MYCRSCGRKITHSCSCLKTNPIPTLEVFFLLTITIQAPLWGLKLIPSAGLVLNKDYLFIGSIILGSLLLLITIGQLIIKRPYLALFFGCHQRSERTFKLFRKSLPLCARCTGIYFGILSTILFHALYSNLPFYIYIILAVPLVIDGLIQNYTTYSSNNIKRFITGFLFGYFLMYVFTIYNVYLIRLAEIVKEAIYL